MSNKMTIAALAVALMVAGCEQAATSSAGSVAAPAAESPATAAADINLAFDRYKQQYLDAYWRLWPEAGLFAGRYEFANQLTVLDQGQLGAVAAFEHEQRARLDSFDPARLNATNRGDWAILDNQLNSSQWYREQFRDHEWDPSRYNIASAIDLILGTDYAPIEQRLTAIGERLLRVPAYYQAAQANLNRPALPQTRLAIEQHRGVLNLLAGPLAKAIAESTLSNDAKSSLNERNSAAQQAVTAYISALEAQLPALEAGQARDFRIGEALYEQKFALDINADFSGKAIHERALAEKARLHAEMDRLAIALWPKYLADTPQPAEAKARIRAVLAKVADTHATPEGFVAEVQAQIPELQAFVIANQLMDVDPDKPLVVRETPEYQRGFSVASIEAPGPFASSANTYYNVSPVTAMAPELQQSHLREYNRYTMQILNIHEAIPGHYTQLIHANRSPSLVKALFGNGAMIEGWAVYSERMMLEQGYGNDQPELWLMYYKWNLRAVVNTILDYELHVQGLSEADGLALLMDEAFQEEAEAKGKWRRATLSQVQLASYFSGYQAIYAFREELKAKQGEAFSLKAFHNQFLSYGSAPVSLIRELMLADKG